MKDGDSIKSLLRERGLRATPYRQAALRVLQSAKAPLSAEEMHEKLRGADLVTVYRTLLSFEKKGIVARVNLSEGKDRFELMGEHHHHLVCTNCGVVEDISTCELLGVESALRRTSRKFAKVYSHNLEFLGSCLNCTKQYA